MAFSQPERAARGGSHWQLDYRMHWVAEEPYPPQVARAIETRIGRSGIPGQHEPRGPNGRKFVIDFTGAPAELEQHYDLEVVAASSRGTINNASCLEAKDHDYWRASADLHAYGDEHVGLRCCVRLGERTLTDTWIYQYLPAPHPFP